MPRTVAAGGALEPVWDFIGDRRSMIAFNAYQHALLVFESVLAATVVAVVLAIVVTRVKWLEPVANQFSAGALTLPSFALIGLLLPVLAMGPKLAFAVVGFYAVWPILRNAVVGLREVDPTLLESARGMGMSELTTLWRVRLPLAWPVIHAGVRTSTQMSMGVAAIVAYGLGPGLGSFIFTGLGQLGGANGVNYALVGTIGIVIVALIADGLLLLLGRLTVSKGIRA